MHASARFCYGYGILIITLLTLLFLPACAQHSDDRQPPDTSTIKSVHTTPLANESGVAVNTPIRVVYGSSIEGDDLILNFSMTTGGTLVDGDHSVRNDSVIFYPHTELKGRTHYKITITGSLNETPLETVSFEFTTISTGGTVCEGFYDAAFQLVSGMDNSAIEPVAVPGKGIELTDSAYQTCMVRMTDHINEPPEGFARAEYSRKQAFNANDTLLLALALDGYWHLYDADSGRYVMRLNGPASDAEIRWDAADPERLYYMDTYGGMAVYELSVETEVSRVIGSFEGRLPWTDASRVWTKSEGSSSADGRYWGMQVETSDFRPLGLMVWDQLSDEIVGTWDFVVNGVGRPDHTSMSPSGTYIVASWDGNDLGTTAFSRDFQSRVKLHHKSEHSDLALLSNGNDAYVSVDYQSNAGEVFMVEIQTGVRTRLFDSYINGTATAFHFSGKAYHRPGWVLVSTYGGGPSKEWLHDKIFALSLKENPEILNIAHHHSRANGYWTEPHATVNRDFTRIAFNSNWGKSSETDVDIYQVKIPFGAIPSNEQPDPGGSDLVNKSLSYIPSKVLFIGNSLTGHYDIPATLKAMADEKGAALTLDTEIYGGSTFEDHYLREETTQKITRGDYDTIILQGGAYGPITNTGPFMQYGGLMSDRVKTAGKTPVFYMTWHHRDYFETEAGVVQENYLKLSNSNEVTLNPVGVAFAKVVSEYPDIQLFSDGTHQSEEGAYLSAAMFYAFLLKKDPAALTFNGRIESHTAATLKQVAGDVITTYNKISLSAAP